MKKTITLTLTLISLLLAGALQAQYYQMPVPDTLVTAVDPSTGFRNYSLNIHEGFTNFLHTGNLTVTHGYNQYNFLGPTLIMHLGDNVQMSVYNETNDPTTVHWHGIHLPPVMDGGPHQVIGSGATWKPYWTVSDSASTFWYHSHLDFETDSLVTMGQAGLIIVKDAQEATLNLPRTYGVDDIPVILADRFINTINSPAVYSVSLDTIITSHGDTVVDVDSTLVSAATTGNNQLIPGEEANYMITNGVINAQRTLPAQVVRLRILNASTFRAYNLGFTHDSLDSFNRIPFSVIGSDGGLLNAPVTIGVGDTFIMSPGERYEILLNLTGHTIGENIHMMAFNSRMPYGVPGGYTPAFFGQSIDSLGNTDFQVLDIVVGAATSSPVTTIPTTLKTNNFPDPAAVSGTPSITFTYGNNGGTSNQPVMQLNGLPFQMGINNITVPLGATEEWRLANTNILAYIPPISFSIFTSHVFHIHDVQFKITSIIDTVTGISLPIPAYQQGWKDVIMVDYPQVIKFISRFDDFADTTWPYM